MQRTYTAPTRLCIPPLRDLRHTENPQLAGWFPAVLGATIVAMLSPLDTTIKGRVVVPTDSDWDAARQAFNVLLDVRPAAVAFPVDEIDVLAIVDYARAHGLRI